ncbi:MAG TPA: serine protein kinase PrkA, partial [Polyangium sp.]|nr:serine protein kinase PrkA [Polyangium sp.]
RLRDAFFADRRKSVALLCRDLVVILRDRVARGSTVEPPMGNNLREEQRKNALAAFGRLQAMGYCEHCALEGGSALLRARFAELVT